MMGVMEKAVPFSTMDERTKLGLYVHVPFCETKCGYCDFYSIPLKDRDTSRLVAALIRELDTRLGALDRPIGTVFVGGGTPTLLPPDQLGQLLDAIGCGADPAKLDEFTVEANPATVGFEIVEVLARAGVNRVSMGAQSFEVAELAALERLHSPDDIAPSVAALRDQGIAQLNLDLIFGIPGQTVESWERSLHRAIELEPDHIACYGLTYEPGTRLTAQRNVGRVIPCGENLEADMYLKTVDTLERAGYFQYEISNFAKPGCQSKHNLLYWRNEPYVGVGPSAAGCVANRRYKNVADLGAYIDAVERTGLAEAESETLTTEQLMTELILMQLRTVEGMSLTNFRKRTGIDPLTLFGDTVDHLVHQGLIRVTDTHLALTQPGFLVANAVMAELAGTYGPRTVSLPVVSN